MPKKVSNLHGQEMLLVPKNAIIGFILFSLFLTALLMALFMFVDFDTIFGRKNIAMKVGETSITIKDFRLIKQLSGDKAKSMPDQVFARDLFESLLLAEDARQKGLDQTKEFRDKMVSFDASLNNSGDEERVIRAIHLIEQMANAAIDEMMNEYASRPDKEADYPDYESKKPEIKLHVKEILATNASEAQEILSQSEAGTDFTSLNASWSKSLYKSVGGDMGWKSANDFPEGIFDKLLETEEGKLINAFSDENGIHLLMVLGKHEAKTESSPEFKKKQKLRNLRSRLIVKHIIDLKSKIDYWINPIFQERYQVAPFDTRKTKN
ncbi:MAG: hypothetical protein Kow0029_15070 [Candidatus Rifleibacteriota bacterium]